MKIIIARSALSDLQEIKIYYLEQGVPDVGQKYVNAILKNVQRLRVHPDSGRKVPELIKTASGKLSIHRFEWFTCGMHHR